jgi:heparosan-N-sulfate-glucuronate 5-epimerase
LPISCDGNSVTHNYTRICGWGFAYWSRYLRTRNEEDLRPVLMASEYILRTADRCDMGLVLRGEVAAQGHMGPISAMSQGQAISLLLRSFSATRDEAFLAAAIQCLGAFQRPVNEGGVVSYCFGTPWFEEYTTGTLTGVLNGMIFALWGLSDLAAAVPASGAMSLWLAGVRSLEASAARFDLGWWSAYSAGNKQPDVASISYHSLHIAQLSALAEQAGSSILQQMADRFAAYGRDPVNRTRAGFRLLRSKFQPSV